MLRFVRVAVPVWLILAGSAAWAASTASGDFMYGDTKFQVKNAYAVRSHKKDSIAALYVYLTDKPIDFSEAAKADDPDFPMMSLKDVHYIRLCVTADGGSCGLFQDGFNTSGVGTFKLTTNTATRNEGSWKMDKPDDFFSKKYQFNLAWAVDVAP